MSNPFSRIADAVRAARGLPSEPDEKPTLSASDHFAAGDLLYAAGDLPAAEREYRFATMVDARHAAAWNNLGLTLRKRGKTVDAEEALQRALSIDSSLGSAHYILGGLLASRGEKAEALRHYLAATKLRPDIDLPYIDAAKILLGAQRDNEAKDLVERGIDNCPQSANLHFFAGNFLAKEGFHEGAMDAFRKTISYQPDHAEAHHNLGVILNAHGDFPTALTHLQTADKLNPAIQGNRAALADCLGNSEQWDEAAILYQAFADEAPSEPAWRVLVGNALLKAHRKDEAIEAYLAAQRLDANDRSVNYLVDALTGNNPAQGDTTYITKVFDAYAASFDAHLVGKLHYSMPRKIAATIAPYLRGEQWDVLDLGCGTGLMGEALRTGKPKLVGIDLSTKMLAKARERGDYTRLEQGDLAEVMRREMPAAYDLVVAADVLVYVGQLDDVAGEAHRVLRDGSLLAFSAEAASEGTPTEPGYQLTTNARYVHTADYLAATAAKHGFTVLCHNLDTVREEQGQPVPAWIEVWRRMS